ncbi:MAG: M20/M25/M40 family metallo-hydrolase [Bacteroidales bacterium]
MRLNFHFKLGAGTAIGLVSAFFAQAQPDVDIMATDIARHIQYLASDALQGRDTPSPGLDSAAVYIAREFHNLGLAPVGNSYFHDLGLARVDLGPVQQLTIHTPQGSSLGFQLKDDFVPLESIGDTSITAPLVFAGYGLHLPDQGYDDYKGIDVRGKIVVVLTHFPNENADAENSTPEKKKIYDYSVNSKIKTARQLGAAGLIVVTDPLNHVLLKPRVGSWPALSRSTHKPLPPLVFKTDRKNFPAIYGGERVIEALFGSVDELKALQAEIDKTMKPRSFEMKGFNATLITSVKIDPVKASNVMAIRPGSDPRQNGQYVVLGAHYDHVGMDRSAGPGQDVIYNGADDNASGTAAVLAIAKSLVNGGFTTGRSLVFVLFAGEEVGLLGSRSMVKNPPFPLDSIAAMLNFDMVSRGGPDTLYLGGLKLSPDLQSLALQEIEGTGLRLITSPKSDGLGGSDHAPFLQAGIPALHFFTGLHRDYHQVTDEFSKVDPQKAALVAQLGLRMALRIADLPQKPRRVPEFYLKK